MGPLDGIKVIEFSALGPGPFCGMILADLGAEVIVIDRIEAAGQKSKTDIASRGKKSIAIDLKKKESINLIKDIVKEADVVIEGLRPGKMEKLGLEKPTSQRNIVAGILSRKENIELSRFLQFQSFELDDADPLGCRLLLPLVLGPRGYAG